MLTQYCRGASFRVIAAPIAAGLLSLATRGYATYEYQSSDCSQENPPCDSCLLGIDTMHQCTWTDSNGLEHITNYCAAYSGSGTLGLTQVCKYTDGGNNDCTNTIHLGTENECCGTTCDFYWCGCTEGGTDCTSDTCPCGGDESGSGDYCTNRQTCA